MPAKFDEEALNSLVSIMFTSLFSCMSIVTDLDLWPSTSKINRVDPLAMLNMSAKFDKEAHNTDTV